MDIIKVINKFETNELPRLRKLQNYYLGKQDIRLKETDEGKPNNKCTHNLCKVISDTFTGYFMGQNVVYESQDNNKELLEKIEYITSYNDDDSINLTHAQNSSIFGKSYELLWYDENKEIRYTAISPLNVIVKYDDTLDNNIEYAIRFYEVADDELSNNTYKMIEVYDKDNIYYYSYNNELVLNEVKQHYFKEVPIIEFKNNRFATGDFECVISIQDDYNNTLSLIADDMELFADSYLAIIGCTIEEEDLKDIRINRTLNIPDNGSAEWLQKQVNDTHIQNILTTQYKNIFTISSCVDLQKEGFGNQSGVAIKYQTLMMQNKSCITQKNFEKAFSRRYDLIINILNLLGGNYKNDISYIFTRDLPIALTEMATVVQQLKGTVSDESLLSLLPFINDVQSELDRVDNQQDFPSVF